MPAIPQTNGGRKVAVDIGSEAHAEAVGRVLAGKTQRQDAMKFFTVMKEFLRTHPSVREELVSWYTDLPGEGEERPRKKKKRRPVRDEDGD